MMNSVDIKFAVVTVGMLDTNCYLIKPPESEYLYIIDPGAEAEKIINKAKEFDCSKVIILLTHAHVDHISAVGQVASELKAEKIYLHSADIGLYNSKDNHLMPLVPKASGLPEIVNEISSDDFEIITTPGHTRGGVCFYFPKMPILFSGDTLFEYSVGRTDFPGGDTKVLLMSIRNKLLTLPDDLEVCPGHGNPTTIGQEKTGNPYLSNTTL
jgi:glyoxylase-like metal-dependent hydrolase (beta-lactamase superfamily II)